MKANLARQQYNTPFYTKQKLPGSRFGLQSGLRSRSGTRFHETIGVLRFHYTMTTSMRTKVLCADIIISCVLPGFLFVIVLVDEMEAMSRSSLYVQKRYENDSNIS